MKIIQFYSILFNRILSADREAEGKGVLARGQVPLGGPSGAELPIHDERPEHTLYVPRAELMTQWGGRIAFKDTNE